MRISSLLILFVVAVAFTTGCAGKRNRESITAGTTYWHEAHDNEADCGKCENDASQQLVESNHINRFSPFRKNGSSDEATGNLSCQACNRKTDVLMDGKCIECLKQNIDQRSMEVRGTTDSLPSGNAESVADPLTEPLETALPSTTRRSTSPNESTGSESFESQNRSDSDNFRSPQKFLTPSNRVVPLPIVSGEVIDKLPLKMESNQAVSDREPANDRNTSGENVSPLPAKDVAADVAKQNQQATGASPDPDPKSDSFRLQSQENTRGNNSQDEIRDDNQGDGTPPLSPPGSWQGNSGSSDRPFSGRTEQEIIRELRRSNVANRNEFENSATISQPKPARQTVLLTARPVPQHQELYQIDQERKPSATVRTQSESNDRQMGSRPNRIPAISVSNRKEVPIDQAFDFRPIPELTQSGQFPLEPVEAEKFIEEIMESFSFPAAPPAMDPDSTDERKGQWFNADSSLLNGSGLKKASNALQTEPQMPAIHDVLKEVGSKAKFRFEPQ